MYSEISRHCPFNCPQVGVSEIEEMIRTVDKNGDGRISYSEFRWVFGFNSFLTLGGFILPRVFSERNVINTHSMVLFSQLF
jgi:hypothetical protein